MSLRFAILTALAERPASGQQLARRFDRSIGYFWQASHQQIYRELDRLHEVGLVDRATPADSAARGNPRPFAITTAGTQALRDWVHGTDAPTPVREALMVRVRAAAALDDPLAVRGALLDQLAAHEEYLRTYSAIEARDFNGGDEDGRSALQHLVLRCGIDLETAWLQWCRRALDQLDALDRRAPRHHTRD